MLIGSLSFQAECLSLHHWRYLAISTKSWFQVRYHSSLCNKKEQNLSQQIDPPDSTFQVLGSQVCITTCGLLPPFLTEPSQVVCHLPASRSISLNHIYFLSAGYNRHASIISFNFNSRWYSFHFMVERNM